MGPHVVVSLVPTMLPAKSLPTVKIAGGFPM